MAFPRNVAFTGTQRGLTEPQALMLRSVVCRALTMHNGMCMGADEQALRMFREMGGDNVTAHGYPSTIGDKVADVSALINGELHAPAPPLVRNRSMVNNSDGLIACPGESVEQLRSGTWATVRYARKIRRPIIYVYPDGDIVTVTP